MNAKEFAWAYLVKDGYAGVTPSYYGGYDVLDEVKRLKLDLPTSWDYAKTLVPLREAYLSEIAAVGVDWSKTDAPRSSAYSRFGGTFSDSDDREALTGVLVLKNGVKQTWYADALELTDLFEIMASADQLREQFNLLFKEPST